MTHKVKNGGSGQRFLSALERPMGQMLCSHITLLLGKLDMGSFGDNNPPVSVAASFVSTLGTPMRPGHAATPVLFFIATSLLSAFETPIEQGLCRHVCVLCFKNPHLAGVVATSLLSTLKP